MKIDKRKLTSIVVPCYNSESSLGELVSGILEQKEPCEVILVNDASSDNTWFKIKALAAQFPNKVLGVDLIKNSGQHAAILIGVQHTKGDVIITMDDDLQHSPSDIVAMAQQVRDGADLVYAVAHDPNQKPLRNFSSKFSLWLFDRVLGMQNVASSSAFRAFSRSSSTAFDQFRGSIVDVDAILSWTASNVETYQTTFAKRRHGNSNYNFRSLISHAAKMIVAFSIVPLRLSFYIGLLTTVLAVVLILYFVFQYLFGTGMVEGFTFLACAIMFFAGVQLFIIGIFGQYLAAIHTQTLGRPVATVRFTTAEES